MHNKVVFFSTCWRGGAGWYVRELVNAIERTGWTVLLVAPLVDPEADDPGQGSVSRIYLPRGAGGVGSLTNKIMRTLGKFSASLSSLVAARRHSGTYVCTFLDFLPLTLAQFLLIKIIGGHLVYIVHDSTPHASGFPRALRWLEPILLRLSYFLPHRLVTLTETARDEIVSKYGIKHSKIDIIPHGAYAPPHATPAPGDGQVILFGTLRRNKRVLEVIQAFKRHHARFPRLRLLLAGEPHRDEKDYWKICAKELATAGPMIEVDLRFLPEAELHQRIAQSDAAILPYEDFNSQSGVVVLTSFSERAIIATAVGGIGELQRQGVVMTPVISPVSEETVADALERFAALPIEDVRNTAEANRMLLEDKLSWTTIGRLVSNTLSVVRNT